MLLVLFAGCAAQPDGSKAMDAIASDFVRLSLEIEARDPNHLADYFGPTQWEEQAQSRPRPLADLSNAAAVLVKRTVAVDPSTLDADTRRRRAFLLAQLQGTVTRLHMLRGERLSFVGEFEGMFGIQPNLKPLSAFDPILREVEAMVPGQGALADRVDAFENRFIIPSDKVDPVMRAAIAECRRRTEAHIALPKGENFKLLYVTGPDWSGSNLYLGDRTSQLEMNVELPVRMNRAIDLACHELYPGHHVFNLLLDDRLAQRRKWVEFTIYPRFSPQSVIAEGAAGYGAELAFPGDERLVFEKSALYPLAGLPTADAGRYRTLLDALDQLEPAGATIARDYLEGRINRDKAIALTRKYRLLSVERARRMIGFVDDYRTYAIIYGMADDIVRDHVERAGPGQGARWAALEHVISEPTLPSDLVGK